MPKKRPKSRPRPGGDRLAVRLARALRDADGCERCGGDDGAMRAFEQRGEVRVEHLDRTRCRHRVLAETGVGS